MKSSLALPVLIGALASGVTAQGNIGDKLTPPELEGFANTEAKSYGDFAGRTILLEFFAYW